MKKVFSRPKSLRDIDTHYCPGCTHGISHRLVAEVLDEMGIREKTIGVAPVGCSVFAYNYFNHDFVEASHGRAPAMATGIKRVRPENTVYTYQGDGVPCLTDPPTCPFGRYSNEIDPVTSIALAGAGLQLADDMTLAGTGARDLVYLNLGVYGGNSGGGAFDVTVELWTDCPGDGGTLIPDTTFIWTGIPDDGYLYLLIVDPLSPAVTIPDTVWMVATFSTPESGWVIAEQAESGFTEDLFGQNDPPWVCNYYFGGDPYAGMWANLRCQVGETKRGPGGDGQPELHMIRLEAETPPTLEAIGTKRQ